jgi:hypothetical protein
MFKASLALVTIAVLSTGCATILNEPTQGVNISGTGGKSIAGTIDGKTFSTSGIVQVKRQKAAHTLTVTTPGCAKETLVASNVDPKFFINVLSGGPLGSSTDYGSDRMWKYDDNIVVSCN